MGSSRLASVKVCAIAVISGFPRYLTPIQTKRKLHLPRRVGLVSTPGYFYALEICMGVGRVSGGRHN